jgi:hypothetical protein
MRFPIVGVLVVGCVLSTDRLVFEGDLLLFDFGLLFGLSAESAPFFGIFNGLTIK